MPQFRIALGYRTAHRGSEPEIIAASFSPVAVQAAIDEADPAFQRIEVGAFQYMRKGRKKFAPVPQAPEPEVLVPEPLDELPHAEELDMDGPSLAPVSPRRRR